MGYQHFRRARRIVEWCVGRTGHGVGDLFRPMAFFHVVLAVVLLNPGHALEVGDRAPSWTATLESGAKASLSDHPGKYVLLYFYPKDETPGCTKQACRLRDSFARFESAGIVVYGVSRQSAESHRAFASKHKLPFHLIADEDGKLADSYGIKRVPILGLYKRQSVLIGSDGLVKKVYRAVEPEGHAAEVLADHAKLMSAKP